MRRAHRWVVKATGWEGAHLGSTPGVPSFHRGIECLEVFLQKNIFNQNAQLTLLHINSHHSFSLLANQLNKLLL
jgi:hypothetical protein